MKNIFWKLIGLSLIIPFFTSCNLNGGDGKMNIVTTIFPEYDWVMNILGEKKNNANVTLLLDSGIDLHSYQPTPKDIVTISKSDLFIYVGGESDSWVNGALKQATNKDMKVINLMDILGDAIKEEEVIEGMEGEEEEEEGEEEIEYDEHVWLSLQNAEVLVKDIGKVIAEIDKDNANYYDDNVATYVNSLKDLDTRYEQAVKAGNKDTVLFADRFPFRYLVDDYNLKYYAAFVGCSAETEASFETIKFLANKVDELGLSVIFKIESSDGSIANTVKNATTNKDQTILTMDSIQSASTKEYQAGRNYLSIMEQNLTALKEALK
ncbi:MAG: zinc ABC transporter substrate-binding protein [Bacilli bacterium]|nr:zinc ABC transporter substrate-binding protein [Bacilli bacterium]